LDHGDQPKNAGDQNQDKRHQPAHRSPATFGRKAADRFDTGARWEPAKLRRRPVTPASAAQAEFRTPRLIGEMAAAAMLARPSCVSGFSTI
jgi:hypothetical protein